MTQTELQQLINRVENDLANNWAVDKDDIRQLVDNSRLLQKHIEPYEYLLPMIMFISWSGSETVNLNDVSFDQCDNVRDWRKFVPDDYKNNWNKLSLITKRTVFSVALNCANIEKD